MSDLQSNIQVGALRGVAIGAFFSVGALIMVLVRGTGVLEDYRIGLLGLIAYNLLGGAVTGAIVGSLLPFAMRNSLGAAGVGFVAMLPASIVGMLLVTPPTEWHEIVPIGSLVGAALLGGLGGALIRSQDAGETTPNWRFISIVVAVAGILALSMRLEAGGEMCAPLLPPPNKRLKPTGPAFRGKVRLCASLPIPQHGALAPASARPAA